MKAILAYLLSVSIVLCSPAVWAYSIQHGNKLKKRNSVAQAEKFAKKVQRAENIEELLTLLGDRFDKSRSKFLRASKRFSKSDYGKAWSNLVESDPKAAQFVEDRVAFRSAEMKVNYIYSKSHRDAHLAHIERSYEAMTSDHEEAVVLERLKSELVGHIVESSEQAKLSPKTKNKSTRMPASDDQFMMVFDSPLHFAAFVGLFVLILAVPTLLILILAAGVAYLTLGALKGRN